MSNKQPKLYAPTEKDLRDNPHDRRIEGRNDGRDLA